MTRWWLLLSGALAAVVLGALVALPFGQEQRISAQIWLAASVACGVLLLLRRAVAVVPVISPGWRSLLGWSRPIEVPVARLPRELLVLEGTMIGARDSARGYSHRLRPRLRAVTSHYLLTRFGVDDQRQPEQAAQILGDLAWLVAPGPPDRAPTLEEVERLMDLLTEPDDDPALAANATAMGGPS